MHQGRRSRLSLTRGGLEESFLGGSIGAFHMRFCLQNLWVCMIFFPQKTRLFLQLSLGCMAILCKRGKGLEGIGLGRGIGWERHLIVAKGRPYSNSGREEEGLFQTLPICRAPDSTGGIMGRLQRGLALLTLRACYSQPKLSPRALGEAHLLVLPTPLPLTSRLARALLSAWTARFSPAPCHLY